MPPAVAVDRRKQILRAAIQVFAERGFHKTRVSDIARRAGVAYGLIYHYFDSKDAVLDAVFEENWAVFLKVLRDVRGDENRSAGDRLGAIVDLLINALRIEPELIQVIIQEVSRSDRLVRQFKVEAFREAFLVVQAIISEGQARREIRATIDPLAGAYILIGALEAICTGFLMKVISCATDEEAERLKRSVKEAVLGGMVEPVQRREGKARNA